MFLNYSGLIRFGAAGDEEVVRRPRLTAVQVGDGRAQGVARVRASEAGELASPPGSRRRTPRSGGTRRRRTRLPPRRARKR